MNTSILEQSYPGYRSFVDNILSKIFDGWNIYPVPEDQIDGSYSDVVTSCIKSVYKVADNTPLDASRIELYDVTVRDTVNIARARVGIRELIKRLHFPYTHAFILFHYENPEGRSWRFSYLYKEGTQANMTNAKRYTYVFGPNCPCRTAVQRLTKLAGLKQIHDKDIKDAFSVEALSEEFFAEYKEHYADFVQYVTGKRIVEVSAKKFETIDVCAPNEEFYNAFGRDDKRVRDYVKKMMGRLVFLCFIQRKKWLNANPYYLQELFANSTRKDDFLDAVLEPMFFGLLNTKPEERDRYFQQNNWDMSLIPGATNIPYLNGGLFEADENDAPPSKFPMELFSNELSAKAKDEPKKYTYSSKKEKSEIYDYHRFRGLLDFFAAYNFTIDENDPNDAEVGVDPEMLGKIFENLLEDNKDKGAFYTPKEIVQYMCRESLIAYLQTDIESEDTKAELRDFVITHEASCLSADKDIVAEKLRTVKICDPAIGSGAFPMGLLNELVACREALFPNQDKAQLKKEIIQDNIYGVDIEKGAIDIARLRFWLSIVVDLEKAEPLPNFDYKFMQGNSLLEQYEGFDLSHLSTQQKSTKIVAPQKDLFGNIIDGQLSFTFTQEECVKNLSTYLNKYFQTSNHAEKELIKTSISEAVRSHILYNIDIHKKQQERFLSDAEVSLQKFNTDLEDRCQSLHVEKSSPAVADIQKKIKKASKKREECSKAIAQYDKLLAEITNPKFDVSANDQFMLWHTWFKDVFEKGGFDIVIGNPPYIQLQSDGGALASIYEDCNFESYNKVGDIYSLFYEFGTSLLKESGSLCYITSNSWMRNDSGKENRRFFLKHTTPILLVDFAGLQLFKNATVETNILLLRKGVYDVDTLSATLNESVYDENQSLGKIIEHCIVKMRFTSDDSWVILDDNEYRIQEKIRSMSLPLAKCDVFINFGLKTGYNSAFIIDDETRKEIYDNAANDEKTQLDGIIKPVLRGRDIKRYTANWANMWIINTHNGLVKKLDRIDVKALPSLKEYLDSHWEKISSRSDKGATPYNLRNCAYLEELDKPKIVWGEISDRSKFCYDADGIYIPEATTFFMTGDISVFLLCYLNSRLAEYLFSKIATTTGMGTVRWKKYKIEQLLVPTISDSINKQVQELYAKYIETSEQHYLVEIDRLVYELYGLTNGEVKIIDPEAVVNGSDDELFNA